MKKSLVIELAYMNIGDMISALSCIPYLMNNSDYEEYIIKSNYYEGENNLANLCQMPKKFISVPFFYQVDNEHDTVIIFSKPQFYNKKHLIDIAYESFIKDTSKIKNKNYIKYNNNIPQNKIELPENYIIIHSTFHDIRRSITDKILNDIIEFCCKMKYTPVLVGSRYHSFPKITGNDTIVYNDYKITNSNCIDLIDKTTLTQLLYIMSKAKLFVGSDSGILHIAGMTEIPVVAIFTSTIPKYILPIRNDILGYNCKVSYSNIECKGCINNSYFNKTIDECKDPKCVKMLNSNDIIDKIKKSIKT